MILLVVAYSVNEIGYFTFHKNKIIVAIAVITIPQKPLKNSLKNKDLSLFQ
jgi:hypothetical protein